MRKFQFLSILMLIILCNFTFAQKTVTGTVTDASDNLPLPGVNIIVKGTTNGITSDIDGKYSITVKDEATVLVYSFIGYTDKEVAVANRAIINVALESSATGLDEVVVTALGIKKEKKSLGYSMQELKSDKLNSTMNSTVSGALQGKVAGVQISSSGSGVGGASKITIRGNSSMTGNNEPLWVVDGIPLDDSQTGSSSVSEFGTSENRGVDRSGGASDINPDDIASISVLKGPNAAALYGSRAANGVIIVTTKKGTSKGVGVRYNGSLTLDFIADQFEYQNTYGQGDGGVFSTTSINSWGPKMSGQLINNWVEGGEQYKMEAQEDRLTDFYRDYGVSQNHNISIDKATKDYSVVFSLGRAVNKGIYPGSQIEKNSYNIRANAKITDKLTIDSKLNYIHTEGENRPTQGLYGAMAQFLQMPRNIRTTDLDPGYNSMKQHINWVGPNATARNPYFQKYRDGNRDVRDRLIGFVSASYAFTDNLRFTLRHGMDYHRTKVELMIKDGYRGIDDSELGYWLSETNFREENTDFLLAFSDKFGDFSISANAGGNIMKKSTDALNGRSGKLAIDGAFFLSNGTVPVISNSLSEQEVQSFYAFGQIGYKDYLYLDITGRNDWSSTLSKDNHSFFYPSVSLSVVATDAMKTYGMDVPNWLTFAKLRSSYAFVGNSANPYQLVETMTVTQGINGANIVVPGTEKALADLKPEQTKSLEFGLDLKMLDNRFGFDFTYYNATTVNQIMGVPVPPSSGYIRKTINAGEIENKGFEFMIYTVPFKTEDFTWSLDFNFSKNETFVNELDVITKEQVLGTSVQMVNMKAVEGEKFGEIYGRMYRRDDNGNIIVGADGVPLYDDDKRVGNVQADWTGSLSSTIDYKGFSLGLVFDIKQGGDIVSVTESIAAAVGNAKITEDRKDFVFAGVTETGAANTKSITTEQFYSAVGGRYGVAEEFVYDASYVKLRELSLGYNIPKSFLTKSGITSAKLSIVGRNLFYLQNNLPGTTPEGGNDRSLSSKAYDLASQPLTRTVGFNLSIKF